MSDASLSRYEQALVRGLSSSDPLSVEEGAQLLEFVGRALSGQTMRAQVRSFFGSPEFAEMVGAQLSTYMGEHPTPTVEEVVAALKASPEFATAVQAAHAVYLEKNPLPSREELIADLLRSLEFGEALEDEIARRVGLELERRQPEIVQAAADKLQPELDERVAVGCEDWRARYGVRLETRLWSWKNFSVGFGTAALLFVLFCLTKYDDQLWSANLAVSILFGSVLALFAGLVYGGTIGKKGVIKLPLVRIDIDEETEKGAEV